ncbi:MAG: ASKHA domain-containing protein [Planctomycetota bacterium]|jgi:uncharacterized 2Fe-2S/4Fe-4S cluster protein (DUF4445 family)
MKHFNVILRPDGKQISIHEGATLLDAAAQAGIILNTVCGGRGTCRKCLAYLDPDGRQVLACQCRIGSDVAATIPPESRFFEQRILANGLETREKTQPDIYEEYSPAEAIFGLAVDLGTTTVVAKLIDMRAGRSLATEAALNPQTRFGDDVVSRIAYAETSEQASDLHRAAIDCINDLIAKLCQTMAVSAEEIYEACIVGNTTMSHIFLELPVTQLGRAPYEAFSLEAHDLAAGDSALKINSAGNIRTVENIAGFVGSDTVAGALATDMDCAEETTLIVDIGTNGEIVLAAKDELYAASCAAGPAFEGARITCGGRAADGAVEAVVAGDDDIDLDIIGNCVPRSMCGSGLIDAIAVLLDFGIIDRTGRFADRQELKERLPSRVFSRIIEYEGQPAFCLVTAEDESERPVVLSQKDIRESQLAKAAIRAGIRLLQQKMGIEDRDIARILLAGAFGNYINPRSALRIGLLPEVGAERIHFVGNAASVGAQMILVCRRSRNRAGELARKIEYVETAHQGSFQDVFADSLLFPPL